MANRFGIFIYKRPDGAKYQGQWVNNKVEGSGKFQFADGDIYDGHW